MKNALSHTLTLTHTVLISMETEYQHHKLAFTSSVVFSKMEWEKACRKLQGMVACNLLSISVSFTQVLWLTERWKQLLPEVVPFYAIKCNPDAVLVRTLKSLGCGFDCASQGEISLVTSMGVLPERIIYANPLKNKAHLRYAREAKVACMTFDSIEEMEKVIAIFFSFEKSLEEKHDKKKK